MATTPTPPSEHARRDRVARIVAAFRHRRRRRAKSLGQSMAEFALTVPLALFMVLFGLDFGRVFLGWVSLNQAAREAANYAAMNPKAWTSPYDYAVQSEYSRLVRTEASNINCSMSGSVPAPSFPSGTSIAAPVRVTLTCSFGLITPIISNILGNSINVTASSAFPIRSGTIEGVPIESTTPTSTPGPTATAGPTGSPGPTATVDPLATVAPTPTAAPTAAPTSSPEECMVPSLIGLKTNKATATWNASGFTGAVVFSPLTPPVYTISWQSLTVGTERSCSSGITVRSNAP
jgi:Flp pilus assembly protein TadG